MKRRGFSLLEIVVALSIFALVALVLAGMVPNLLKSTKEASYRSSAEQVGRTHAIELAQSSTPTGVQPPHTTSLNGTEFTVEAEVTECLPDVPVQPPPPNPHSDPPIIDALSSNQSRLIKVKVSWNQGNQRPHSVTVRRQIFLRT